MELISTFDFVDMFPEGQSLAFVGNSRSILDNELGNVIDAYDIVIRFNECALTGFERYAGSKTSILVANPYAETRTRPLLDEKKPDVVFIINPQTRRGNLEIFKKWVGSNKVFFTYTPSLIQVQNSDHVEALTTGTYALQILPRILRPSKVLITGFTLFNEVENSHYWQAGKPGGLKAHNMVREVDIFINILNSFKFPIKVSSDVWSIQNRSTFDFNKHVSKLSLEVK